MSNKRITTTMLPASYADGQVLYGYDINKIITVLREGINFNKYAFETFLGGDSDVIVRDAFEFLPVGTDNPAVGDVTPTDGDIAFVFEKDEDGDGNLIGYTSLKRYEYDDATEAWVEQEGYT
ncbi:MAG: hypothetical protein M0P69_09765, partial [Bacteroidales bacterium]|nr:hypothetical protein [Bacteroidales bacterium]